MTAWGMCSLGAQSLVPFPRLLPPDPGNRRWYFHHPRSALSPLGDTGLLPCSFWSSSLSVFSSPHSWHPIRVSVGSDGFASARHLVAGPAEEGRLHALYHSAPCFARDCVSLRRGEPVRGFLKKLRLTPAVSLWVFLYIEINVNSARQRENKLRPINIHALDLRVYK